MNIEYNYHTHTKRCHHAGGDVKDYAAEAAKAGIKVLGMSDHGPFKDFFPGSRMDFEEVEDYRQECLAVREEYRGRMDLKIGLEYEYIRSRDALYEEMLTKYQMEYLVLGQHFFEDRNGNMMYVYQMEDTQEFIEYALSLNEGMKTGYFKFAAHPDLIFMRDLGWDINCDRACDIIVDGAVKGGYMLEFNANGLRRGIGQFKDGVRYQYPHMKMFERIKEAGIEVIINSDCHQPEQVADEEMVKAYKMCREMGLKLYELKQ